VSATQAATGRSWGRWIAALALALYAGLLGVVLLSPRSTTQSGLVSRLVAELVQLGVPDSLVTFARAEVLMNAVIVVPLTFLGSLVLRRLRWQDWTTYAFLGACAVELFQGIALPHRHASFSDIVANTLGALVGALLVRIIRGSKSPRRPLHTP
jgi:glycopeptide antibiotics resistance protein